MPDRAKGETACESITSFETGDIMPQPKLANNIARWPMLLLVRGDGFKNQSFALRISPVSLNAVWKAKASGRMWGV